MISHLAVRRPERSRDEAQFSINWPKSILDTPVGLFHPLDYKHVPLYNRT